ncbi:MAG: hypothetical protein IIY21_10930 [Clostridiales bacterium]|nr:hypothetical protein [Clostridiales bacterium]MBQ1571178.1 hypothetical protein [Clostridiales bacterium]
MKVKDILIENEALREENGQLFLDLKATGLRNRELEKEVTKRGRLIISLVNDLLDMIDEREKEEIMIGELIRKYEDEIHSLKEELNINPFEF